jgi:RNA polymerase sigma factor (TIGR02999 family)
MEITELLRRAHEGDSESLKAVIPLVYDELKILASSNLRREHGDRPMQTTVLVHEAFLRLVGSRLPECQNRSHFFGIAARVMRQVLVDLARSRQAEKRGPGLELSLAVLPELAVTKDSTFLALDDALNQLSLEAPLKSQLIELYFFCGLTAEESAATVNLPVHTVRKELRLAKAWLLHELGADRSEN